MNPQSQNIIRSNNFHTVSGNVNISSTIQQTDPVAQYLMPFVALGAGFDSSERDPAPKCHPGTRKEMLKKILDWAAMKKKSGQVMWLHGPAGAGKSAIAQTICETCASGQTDSKLAASFFFSRGHPTRGIASTFFPTIASQLATSIPGLRPHLAEIINRHFSIVSSSMETQVKYLVATPFHKYIQLEVDPEQPWMIVVNGVDECRSNNDQARLLNHLLDLIRIYLVPLSILIVSRPEAHIKDIFFDEISDCRPYADIRLFLEDGFAKIRRSKRHADVMRFIKEPWPSLSAIDKLVDKSNGYYIYAATVLKFVDTEYYSPIERLHQVMDQSQDPDSDKATFAELDALYTQILSTCPDRRLLKNVLGFHLTFEGLLSPMRMENMLGLTRGRISLTLRSLHSLIGIENMYMRFYHASFSDFLLDVERAGDYFTDRKGFLLEMLPPGYWWLLNCGITPGSRRYFSRISACSHIIARPFDKSTIMQCWKFLFQDMQKWRNLCQSSSRSFCAQKKLMDAIVVTIEALGDGIAREDQFEQILIMMFEEHLWRSASPVVRRFMLMLSSILTCNNRDIDIGCATKLLSKVFYSLPSTEADNRYLFTYLQERNGSSFMKVYELKSFEKFVANLNHPDSKSSEQYNDAVILFFRFFYSLIFTGSNDWLSCSGRGVHRYCCVCTGVQEHNMTVILLEHFLPRASSDVRDMILYFRHVITAEIFSHYKMMLRIKSFRKTILTAVAENSRSDVSSYLSTWRSILEKYLPDDEEYHGFGQSWVGELD